MTTTVKVVAGALGAAAIGAGGIAISKLGGTSFNHETSWHSLAEDNSFSDSSYSGKFAEKLARYFVGPDPRSEAWWKWSFKRLKEDNVREGKFSIEKLEEGYVGVTNDDKSLNNMCENAYKANPSEVVDSGSDNNKFNKSEVWKYCSPVGQEPKTIDKNNNAGNNEKESGTIGESEKSTLISVADEGNKVFWEIRDKEFKAKNLSSASSSKFFQKGKEGEKHIKDLCSQAYKQDKNNSDENDKATSEGTKKYCSLTFSAQ